MKSGWHVIHEANVFVENNKVVRCLKKDSEGKLVVGNIYKRNSDRKEWEVVDHSVNVHTFMHDDYCVK